MSHPITRWRLSLFGCRDTTMTAQANLTAEGLEALERELEHLTITRRREVADRIHKASEDGGTVDNAEYEDAKNEQAFVEGRISDLQNILSGAVVATKKKAKKGDAPEVAFGSSVTVAAERSGKRVYKVVGTAEAAPLQGKISVESPVGRALMGHKVGDEVAVETPSGVVNLTIVKIT